MPQPEPVPSDRTRDAQPPLFQATAAALVLRVGGAGLLLLVQGLLARWLGATPFGEVALLVSWLGVAVMIAKGGFDLLTLRWVATYLQQGATVQLNRFRRLRRRITLLISGLAIAAGCAAIALLGGTWSDSLRYGACVLLAIIPLTALIEHGVAELRAAQRIVLAEWLMWVVRPAVWLAGCLVFYSASVPLDSFAAIALYALATLLALGLVASACRAMRGSSEASSPSATISPDEAESAKTWLQGAWFTWLAAASTLALTQCDVLVLGLLTDAGSAGVYALASRVSGLVLLALATINGVGGAQIAHAFARHDHAALRQLVQRITLLSALATLPAVASCWLAAHFVFPLLGPEFVAASAPLAWLLVGQTVNALCGPVGYLAALTGRDRLLARVLIASAAINLLLQGIFVALWGMIGAAVATALATILWNVWLAAVLKAELGFDPTIFGLAERGSCLRPQAEGAG